MLPLAVPALPLDEAGKYVAGAYVVFLVLLVVYVAIMAAKLQRIERELRELATFAEARANAEQAAPAQEEVGA
jgi:type II secretory pathway component PulM